MVWITYRCIPFALQGEEGDQGPIGEVGAQGPPVKYFLLNSVTHLLYYVIFFLIVRKQVL